MQIVIDIPDGTKHKIDNGFISQVIINHLWDAVKNGTPLPEHHGDLKDVNKIKEEAIDMSQWGSDTAYGVWVEDIDEAPTIIPATKEEKSCKNCEHGFDSEDCYKCDKNIQNTCEPKQTATKEGAE